MVTQGVQLEFEGQPSDTLASTQNPLGAVPMRVATAARSRAVPEPTASASDLDDPLVGRVVHGRFRVLELIARGGMGRVYRAEQAPLGRICALKVLHPRHDGKDDPGFQKRFFLEAATAARLTHPNTVTVFDYGRDGDVYFIAMELVQGRTLYRRLRQDGPMHEALVVHIISQAARSLREAHALGLIHRDIKPANIAVDEVHGDSLQVKVLDFGLVKELADESDELTLKGLFLGSPKYMAPEQILDNPVSCETDIYALGVVAYELLVGRAPFDSGSPMKTLMAHLNQTPPPLSSVRPDIEISPEVETIVMRCLHKDPAHRFASMDALLEAFGELSNDWSSSGIRIVQPPPSEAREEETTVDELDWDWSDGSASEPADASGAAAVHASNNGPSETPAPMHHSLLPLQRSPRRRWSSMALAAFAGAALVLAITDLVGLLEWPQASPAARPQVVGAAGIDQQQRRAETETPRPSPSPKQATASASKPASPVLREVTVRSTPPGARVMARGKQLCLATPCILTLRPGQSTLLHLSKPGYLPADVRVDSRTRELLIELPPSLPSPGRATPTTVGRKPALQR